MNKTVSDYLEHAPTSARGILERAFTRSGGRANALKAKCLSCANFVREEVRECSVSICPLHPWRPFQPKPGQTASPTPLDEPDDTFDLDDDDDLDSGPSEDDDEL